jgi:hypothetical protein
LCAPHTRLIFEGDTSVEAVFNDVFNDEVHDATPSMHC